MYNKIFLIGNLGRDPEVRSLPSGTQVCDFTVATNRRWKDRDGNPQEKTEWFRSPSGGDRPRSPAAT